MSKEISPPVVPVAGITSTADLREAVDVAAGHRNALDGQLVDIARWLLSNSCWQGEGLSKPEQYLAFRCGLSPTTARRYVDAARRADELPESVAALRAGELSIDQLMPIVRRVPSWADSQVLSLSKRLTVGQINAVIGKYDFERSGPLSPEPTDESPSVETARSDSGSTTDSHDHETPSSCSEPVPLDRCWFGTGDDGRWRLHAETSTELGMLIEAAIRESGDAEYLRSGALISGVEALADACTRSLATIDDPTRRERYRTNIHIHTDRPNTDALGRTLPDVIARHISCDGMLTPVFSANGVPISVGRSQRIVPDRTRKIVLLRDGGCVVPGCGASLHLEVHHIVHWSNGGPTDTSNLVSLCRHHHRMHHHGRLGITGTADSGGELTITNQHGVDMRTTGARPKPPEGPPPAPSGEYAHPLGERLDMDDVDFAHPERLEYRANAARAHAEQYRLDRRPAVETSASPPARQPRPRPRTDGVPAWSYRHRSG